MMQLKDKSPIIFFVAGMLLCTTFSLFAADPPPAAEESPSAMQLRINKNALLQGSTQESRNEAAMVLLISADADARKVLTEALLLTDNPAGRRAICNALVSSRVSDQDVSNKSDFLDSLLRMLTTEQGKDAQLAAAAILIFDFEDLAAQLKEIRLSADTPKQGRLNIIYALELRHSDKDALIELVEFLGDADKDVADAAAAALPYWSHDMEPKEILSNLKRKNQQDIVKDRIIFLEKAFRKIEVERNSWLAMYMELLGKTYETADDTVKVQLLFEKLDQGSPAVIKLWALEKVSTLPGSLDMPAGFTERLLTLLTDPDKKVRLATANLLFEKSDLNSAEILLAQLKVEKNDEVKLAIVAALGEACYYAMVSADITLPEQIRTDALAEALRYLKSDDSSKSRTGAIALRKLIEPNGMKKEFTNVYLEQILLRYDKITPSEQSLKADLLKVMAGLADQQTTRDGSAKLFRESFIGALNSDADKQLREAGVLGLTNIDKAAALAEFTGRAMYNDDSSVIADGVIKLAGQVGAEGDIDWLATKLESNGTGKLAWQAMREILRRQQSEIVAEWAGKLLLANANPSYINDLIDIAEDKVTTEDNADDVRVRINEELIPLLLDVYLKAGDAPRVSPIVSKRLTRLGDIGTDDKVVIRLDSFFASQQVDDKEKTTLLAALSSIEIPEGVESAGVKWTRQLADWQKKLTPEPAPAPAASPKSPAIEAIPAQ